MKPYKKLSIEELAELFKKEDSFEHADIRILPNGEIVPLDMADPKDLKGKKSITFREDLGGEYGIAA